MKIAELRLKSVFLVPALFTVGLFFASCDRQEGESSAAAAADSLQGQRVNVSLPANSPLSYEERQGENLYDRYCAICHGGDGAGNGFNAYNLEPKPRSFADSSFMAGMTDASLRQVISRGGRGVNKSPEMPAYQYTLRPKEIGYLIAYIRSLGPIQVRRASP